MKSDEPAPPADAPPLRILLVEDDDFDVAVFHRAFRRSEMPCEIVRCWRAEEALEGLRTTAVSFDLLVADQHLPGRSGLELCLELLDAESPLALVLLTGRGSVQVAMRALRAGVNDYIVKESSERYMNLLPVVLTKVARRHRRRLRQQREEQRLKELRRVAREASHAKSTQLQDLARDLRTELQRIRQTVEDALGTSLATAPQEALEAFQSSTRRGSELVDEILGIAKIETHEIQVPVELRGPARGRPREDKPEPDTNEPLVAAGGRPPQVLVAHPNPIVTHVTGSMLERLGCEYASVRGERQAVEALEREPFDAVLIDARMLEEEGFEAARWTPGPTTDGGGPVPIVALFTDPADAERWHQLDVGAALVAPLGRQGLHRALLQVLR